MGLTCVAVKADLGSVEHNAKVGEDSIHGPDFSPLAPETVKKMM